jgi:DNA-binding CsgD family transcriptional regulator
MLRCARPAKPWYLEGRTADGRRWTIPLSKNPFLIGRSEDCDLSLLDCAVSRRHAEVSYSDRGVSVRDLSSTNGTFVNKLRVKGSTVLRGGDCITFGRLSFLIVSTEEHAREAARCTVFASAASRRQGFAEFYGLSRREEQTLSLLLQGRSTRAIAQELCVSFGTAKNHTFHVFGKCGVHSRYELIALYSNFALRNGD